MIIILKRADLRRVYADVEASMVRVYQVGLKDDTVAKAELIVLIDNSKVYVLKANKWPYGKPMSAAELIQYIANHVA
jgi:hypothetical protein